jgi:hypothetical protein
LFTTATIIWVSWAAASSDSAGWPGSEHLAHHVRRHDDAAVGDARRDHRHLQRRDAHVELADAGQRGLRPVRVVGVAGCGRGDVEPGRGVEAELP